jgi:hypothetical protein
VVDGGASIHAPSLGRQQSNAGRKSSARSTVRAGLSSTGRALDCSARAFMESRFNHDFSTVRVHTDENAARSARSVNATAYASGDDLVFDSGQYAPHTLEGRRLLAHELAHVVQQNTGASPATIQRQERRQPAPAPVDAAAQQIITAAQDTAATPAIDQRAIATVQAIIAQYFPAESNKVSRIVFRDGEPGLLTTSAGSGATATGIITVGRYFVEHTTQREFARRVLQVRHEIEHIDQIRSGMQGENRSDEREFFAFYHEALARELPGTGRMGHATRVQLIDAALGHYYCLSAELQQNNISKRDELTTRRSEEVRRSGRTDLGSAPTSCAGGLSGWAIAGIVLGSIALAGGIGVGIAAAAGAFR